MLMLTVLPRATSGPQWKILHSPEEAIIEVRLY